MGSWGPWGTPRPWAMETTLNLHLTLRTLLARWLFGGSGVMQDVARVEGDFPNWAAPLVLVLVAVCLYMGALLFYVLVSKRQHQQLLRVSESEKNRP
mgnify:CR=1 FL=1